MSAPSEEIGLVGLGLVGSAMYATLLERGYEVRGFDIIEEKRTALAAAGGVAALSAAEVGDHCRIVLTSLLETRIVTEALFGKDGAIETRADAPDSVGRDTAQRGRQVPPVELVIDTTTGDPEETATLERRLCEAGIDYVDATISGSSEQIRRRKGVFLVGGRREAYERAKPVIEVLAERHYYVGGPGAGAKAKLVSNLILGLNRLALTEGLVFAEKLGLELGPLLEVLKNTPAYSVAMDVKGDKLLAGDYTPQSRISQHRKDLDIIQHLAERVAQPLPLAALHRELLVGAERNGLGEADTCAVIEEIRRLGK